MRVRILIAILLGACGGRGSSQPAPPSNTVKAMPPDAAVPVSSPAAPAVATLQRFKDEMCKCAERTCADRVVEDLAQWISAESQAPNTAPSTEAEMATIGELNEQLAACLQRAMLARGH